MKVKLGKNWRKHQSKLGVLISLLLVMGIFFRFVNIDKKVYWHDETFTSLRVSGYTAKELVQEVFNGRIINVEDLQKYQHPNPEKDLFDTIKGLAVEEPQLPPLYFLMVRLWTQWFGSSVAVTRSFSAFISLLSFPCIYWLCRELFYLPIVGWVAMALIAVSPLHILYAQEARMYSLWIVTILLSSAALMRAMRLKTKLSWGIYAATLLIGIYTHLFFGFVAIGHGIYVLITERFRLSKTLISYLLAFLVALISFAPWLLFVVTNLQTAKHTTRANYRQLTLFSLVKYWLRNLSYNFFDMQSGHQSNFESIKDNLLTYLLAVIALIIIAYSIYYICIHSQQRVWLFVLILIGVAPLLLILSDLMTGGGISSVNRYNIPSYLGIQLAVAYLFATQITRVSVNYARQKLFQVLLIMLISGGIISCVISSQAETWWHKYSSYYNPEIARIINQSTRPLVISDTAPGNVLSISYLLEPKVKLELVKRTIPKIPPSFSNVFLYNPYGVSRELKYRLEKKSKMEVVAQQSKLMQLIK